VAEALRQVARGVADHVDVDGLWSLMTAAPPWTLAGPPLGLFPPEPPPARHRPAIGVVKDESLGFYYPENLEALANFGADVAYISALRDERLPNVHALYLGGGFPETFARRLADNVKFRLAVKEAADGGLPIYAECGGLMFLGRNLLIEGNAYPMCGVFPVDFVMEKKPQGHGYSLCRVTAENPFFKVGYEFKAHEFHYSRPVVVAGRPLSFAYQVLRGAGIQGEGCGLVKGNVLGTYHHLHCLGAPQWAPALVAAAAKRKELA
jgi:cobyrinic acid a,c-diamide synthase